MKNKRLFILSILLLNIFQSSCTQPSEIPEFEEYENYSSVRVKMINAGWEPYTSKDADTCNIGDIRCEGRPEMIACAGTGMANCKFAWQKQEKIIAICTVGDETEYESICSYP